ncbi:MAG: alpha/beta hydrolase [Planctomycetes bacterium]|nr:alpha/beta hydrolase [Planctomycetota bacterium]MCH9725600.1 alpha/beta hydrolase [Planctomycetota bacterium]MCH9777654.1 alpha/beta hydrolase [Planctomycetota bacterium]MDF1743384.1 alpha/beta fold hydrolase [Gimesia sp.]
MGQLLMDQSVNGIKMSVRVSGSGPPLLFVHGFPLNHQMWQAQIDWFQNHFTVIAPDLRGFGDSEITPGTVSMEQHANDLNALLDSLKIVEPVIFCGLSMGGYIAWEFWSHFPERLRAFILCDTRSDSDSNAGIATRLKMVDLVLKHGPESISSSMIPNLISEASQHDSPTITKSLTSMIESTDREGIAASQRGMAERKNYFDKLTEIRIPTLLIVGSEDRLTSPDVMKLMCSSLPHAEYCEVPGTGHMSPMEAPIFVNQAIEAFLASC